MDTEIKQALKDKIVLITGGTGSFGNSVVQKLLHCDPKKVIIFSRDEKKQFDMRNEYNSPLLKFIIGDVRDRESVQSALEGVDYIFHAAALKQVPTCEFFPMEAVKTNIVGTFNVLQEAILQKVKKVVVLSTDKAVYPINAMGISKSMMEKVMAALAREVENDSKSTILCGVRYGNVLYSRGSVLPRFIELIQQNKKLTITNPGMTRFLLPLERAVDLVLYSLTRGENGCLYVRKAPSCTMKTLAQAVCEIFDHKEGYEEIGVRAGEKTHEALISKEELIRTVDLGDYFKIPLEGEGLDYNKYFFGGSKSDSSSLSSYTSENARQLSVDETKQTLLELPEVQEALSKR